jgi:hypothetical protein
MQEMRRMVALQIETFHIHVVAILGIALYYSMSVPAINAVNTPGSTSIFRKQTGVDYCTTALILLAPLFLLFVLPTWAAFISLSLFELLAFYIYFVFFFAFIYCSLNWHSPGAIAAIQNDNWYAEIQYLIVSLQSQTTLGYTRARPNDLFTEFFSAVQALIGVLFVAVAIAKAVGQSRLP